MYLIRLFVACIILQSLSGCAPSVFKKADLGSYGGRTGYLEKEVKPSVYILEYSHIGGYNYDLELNKEYWLRRASELCPNGYQGKFEIIHPAYAKIEEFVCPQRFCSQYPLVSGVIKCNAKT